MKLIIKVLRGGEDSVEVSNRQVTVRELRESYETKYKVRLTENSRLLYKGKNLVDSETLDSYNINDGDKIHLMSKRGPATISAAGQGEFWILLHLFLLKHFSEVDSQKVITYMKDELKRRVYNVPLDLIEKSAAENLQLASSNS